MSSTSDPRTRRGESRRPESRGRGRGIGVSTLWDDERADDPSAGPQPLRASWQPIADSEGRVRERPAGQRPAERRAVRRRSALGWFVHRYGWRAYALPALVALTVVTIVQVMRVPSGAAADGGDVVRTLPDGQVTTVTVAGSAATTTVVTTAISTAIQTAAPASSQMVDEPSPETSTAPATGPNPNGVFADKVKSGVLPPGGEFAKAGAGTWHAVPGPNRAIGSGPQKYTFTIEVEDGIQTEASDEEFANLVIATLSDERSWIAAKKFTLQRVSSGPVNFRISLTSPETVRNPAYCGYGIPLEASCYNKVAGRVLINAARWTRGAVSFHGDLGSYRVYAINHEVGHALGYGHQPCSVAGGLAPVMMQQTFSTSNADLHLLDPRTIPDDGNACKYNAYPYPRGAG